MATVDRQRFLEETLAAKERAAALLKGLLAAAAVSDEQMRQTSRKDPMKVVTGRSAMENAVASTRRMIESLNRAVEEARKDLGDDDMSVLDEAEPVLEARASATLV
jgi:hypothetical protein